MRWQHLMYDLLYNTVNKHKNQVFTSVYTFIPNGYCSCHLIDTSNYTILHSIISKKRLLGLNY